MTKLRDFKKAATRLRKQQERIEILKESQGKKYPQRSSGGTIPSKGELAYISKPLQVKVTLDRYDEVQLLADRQGLSKAEWLRQAIDYYIEKTGGVTPQAD
jgi:hypothetical protein